MYLQGPSLKSQIKQVFILLGDLRGAGGAPIFARVRVRAESACAGVVHRGFVAVFRDVVTGAARAVVHAVDVVTARARVAIPKAGVFGHTRFNNHARLETGKVLVRALRGGDIAALMFRGALRLAHFKVGSTTGGFTRPAVFVNARRVCEAVAVVHLGVRIVAVGIPRAALTVATIVGAVIRSIAMPFRWHVRFTGPASVCFDARR